ncbi:MAG: MFS transporter [Phycisphaerae bacterium]|nr:MFS transporter [Phycisphaerae bacterium]
MAVQHPVDTDGRPIGPLRLRQGMITNMIGGTLICMTLAVMSPYSMICTVFMREQLGATRAQVGLNLALWVGAIVTALPGAYVFNRLRARRPTWVLLMIIGRLFFFVVAGAALLSSDAVLKPTLVVLVIAANVACVGLTSFTSSAWWAWMADLIPESVRGRFFGRRYQIILIATAVTAIAASFLLERVSAAGDLLYFIIFLVAATLGMIDPILFWWVPEPARPPRPKNTLAQTLARYLRPLKDRNFAWLVWTQALNTLLVTMPVPFFVLYQRGEYVKEGVYIGCGISLEFLAVMNVIALATTALVATQWGRLADRIGNRTVTILGRLYFFTTAVYFFMGSENYYWLLPMQLLVQSLIAAGEPVAVQNLMIAIAPQAEREYYVSIFWSAVAAAGAVGPWLGGVLADAVPVINLQLPNGQPACYLHIMLAFCYVGCLVNLPLMLRIPDVRAEPILPWFARLISGGLFRTAWNIGAIAESSSPSRRARALRSVRHNDGNVVLNDVGEALEDPDPGVRREALLALGRIGTPEAVELLIWYLHEPDRTTRTASAEALGVARSAEGTMPLVAALDDADGHVRRAAADALGNLPDQRATETLLGLLDREQDSEVLIGAATALSRIGEFRAIRQMLVMALQNPNRMVRRHITIAMGDLLGPSGRFYEVWRREIRTPGMGSVRLARRLRRQAKALRWFRGHPLPRPRRRDLITGVEESLNRFVEGCQAQDYAQALAGLRQVSLHLLELRYDYRGDPDHALEFIAALDPVLGHRHWLLGYLEQACNAETAPEADWDGLTLLAAWAIFHGQPAT